MLTRICRTALLALGVLLISSPLFSQTGSLTGKVIGEDGNPLQGALVKIERTDIKGNYKVKSNKKGEYFHAGLPMGQYKVTVAVNDQDMDSVSGVRVGLGDPTAVNFDLAELAKRRRAQQQQAQTGEIAEDQLRGMSPEERKKYEEAIKKRREQLGKNKELNEAFNAGMAAFEAKDFQTAVAKFTEASTIDPAQHVIWARLAESQSNLAQTKTGDERSQVTEQSFNSYRKAIELQPDAAYLNNFGLALVKAGKIEEGKAELTKAAELDPTNAGKYYFNLGAIMVNSGNNDGAIEAFRKAVQADPNYAVAQYQLGTALVGAAQMNADGSIKPVPGTVEAFEKYLQIEPNGAYAEGAKGMIATLKGGVQTTYQDPDAKKTKK
jgi:Tfp pilus assembly protein PilF